MCKKHTTLYNRAVMLAKKSDMEHRHACIIVKNNEIIAEGFNKKYNMFEHMYSIHAEVDAISKLVSRNKGYTSDCTMYVFRIGPDYLGNPTKLSKPCKNCTDAIRKAGIKRVYYSIEDPLYAVLESGARCSQSSRGLLSHV